MSSPEVGAPGLSLETGARASAVRHADHWVREVIEALTVAVVLAFTFKHFAFEAYKVPTGSMEPTIMGDQSPNDDFFAAPAPEERSFMNRLRDKVVGTRTGDHIIVNKMTYLVRKPRRFEVVVFRYPNNLSVNYIKRIIGLPNETMFILDGDVYTAPPGCQDDDPAVLAASGKLKIQRKSRELQEAIFDRYPEIDPERTRNLTEDGLVRSWSMPPPTLPGDVEWRTADGAVRVEAVSRSLARFREAVRDNREFTPAGPTNRGGQNVVSDIRLRFRVRPAAAGGTVIVEIHDARHDLAILASVPIEGAAVAGGFAVGGHEVSGFGKVRLPVGQWSEVTVENVDDTLVLMIDGKDVAVTEYEHELSTGYSAELHQGIAFGVEAAKVDFDSIAVHRDIYYQQGRTSRVSIPADSYFVVGDNSPSSKDSREWSKIAIRPPARGSREIEGDTEAVLDPSDLTQRSDNPWWDVAGGRRYFMDRFGNKIDITEGGVGDKARTAPSPFVPSELIVGRAFAVFLPFYRVKVVR